MYKMTLSCFHGEHVFMRNNKNKFYILVFTLCAEFPDSYVICLVLYISLLLFVDWVILHLFLSSADFFFKSSFQKILSGIRSECQTVRTLIRFKLFAKAISRRH